MQPVYPRLGPLLITVGKMMGEIVAFAVPYGFVLSGFATLFSGTWWQAQALASKGREGRGEGHERIDVGLHIERGGWKVQVCFERVT